MAREILRRRFNKVTATVATIGTLAVAGCESTPEPQPTTVTIDQLTNQPESFIEKEITLKNVYAQQTGNETTTTPYVYVDPFNGLPQTRIKTTHTYSYRISQQQQAETGNIKGLSDNEYIRNADKSELYSKIEGKWTQKKDSKDKMQGQYSLIVHFASKSAS